MVVQTTPVAPPNQEHRIVSPDEHNMEIDDAESIVDSVGEGGGMPVDDDMDESIDRIQVKACPCLSQKVGEYLELYLHLEGAQRWCDYVLEIGLHPYRLQKLQNCVYDLNRVSQILGTQEYFKNTMFGRILVAFQYLKLQWSKPTDTEYWNFEEWLDFQDEHFVGYYSQALRDYGLDNPQASQHQSSRNSWRNVTASTPSARLAPEETVSAPSARPPPYQRNS